MENNTENAVPNDNLFEEVKALNTEEFAERVMSGGVIPARLKKAHVTWLEKNQPQILQFFTESGEQSARLEIGPAESAPGPDDAMAASSDPGILPNESHGGRTEEPTGILIHKDEVISEVEEEPEDDSGMIAKMVLGKEITESKSTPQTPDQLGAPDRSFPSKNRKTPAQLAVPPSTLRNISNGVGLSITESDDCFHLNSWRGGCCTINGNTPCSFLEGNQESCTAYLPKEIARTMRRQDIPKTPPQPVDS